ncbi:hypothetical protein HANVADRAFT_25909 [Hanseniaspora valbyensis NRRL Y-1626]|uniref:Exosome complex component CSL4 C-terminal domain-containing protein n=1 Tax=Hanseniaspora valbyensis NRRL Y-1626 TaxID=766949 RepID=A0A1B7TBE6_9ASCO|nr:hypothetical protein HANVADRAFT_25909 [Hanseniaspora valbyensis NRRL Y-1626]
MSDLILNILLDKKDKLIYPGDILAPIYDIPKDSNDNEQNKSALILFHEGKGSHIDDYIFNNIKNKVVVASRRGYIQITEYVPPKLSSLLDPSQSQETTGSDKKETEDDRKLIEYSINIVPFNQDSEVNEDLQVNLPREGDIVLARITKINTSAKAILEILALENTALPKDSGIGSNGSFVSSSTGGTSQLSYSISKVTSDLGEKFEAVLNSKDVRSTERDSVNLADFFQTGDIVRCKVLSIGDSNFYYLSTMGNDLGVIFTRSHGGIGELMYPLDWNTCFGPFTGTEENRKMAKPF